MKSKLKIKAVKSYEKIGVDEIEGLYDEMISTLTPVTKAIKDLAYWIDETPWTPSEYKSRDGFYAHSHNLGGPELYIVIPKCEEYNFDFLEFGDYEPQEKGQSDEDYEESMQSEEGDGLLDAKLRVWLKLESIENNTLSFYLVLEGGNDDAPYFRNTPTIFEADFQCKSVKGLKRAASKHIKKLLNIIGGAK